MHGILTLIPKKDRDATHIKNWRPITLMNTDHKIYAKALANRIKPTLESLISQHQTGYMHSRFTGMNIRKLMDILLYMWNKMRFQHC